MKSKVCKIYPQIELLHFQEVLQVWAECKAAAGEIQYP